MRTKLPLAFLALSLAFTACKKDKDSNPGPGGETLRAKVDYNSLTATTSYNSFFDSKGDTTVDRTEGRVRLRMLKALDAYAKSAVSGNSFVDSLVLKNMFSNINNAFSGSYADLNSSSLQLRNVTGSSLPAGDAADVKETLEEAFRAHSLASTHVSETAAKGKAGKLTANNANKSTYLVDERGIEWAQIISKSFIGGLQVDYIGNILLDKGLDANNSQVVDGKKYTQLEHNWDEAYGLLTVNNIYAATATDAVKDPYESFLGSYVWEYNKDGYKKLHLAFLNGRAAIVNGEKDKVKAQADLIRREFEKAIASAAIGYLGKWKTGTDDATRAHAIGEGAGFIYSLRFCKLNGADTKFSDDILDALLGSENGFWDLDVDKINAASNAIKAKFNIQ